MIGIATPVVRRVSSIASSTAIVENSQSPALKVWPRS